MNMRRSFAPFFRRLRGDHGGINAGFADRFGDESVRVYGRVIGDFQVSQNRRATAQAAAFADARAAGDGDATRHHGAVADRYVVRDLDVVIQLHAVADDGIVQRAAGDGGVGADVAVVADFDATELGDTHPVAVAGGSITEAVAADYHAGSDTTTRTDYAARADTYAGGNGGSVADVRCRRRP